MIKSRLNFTNKREMEVEGILHIGSIFIGWIDDISILLRKTVGKNH